MQEPNAVDIHAVIISADVQEVQAELSTLVNDAELAVQIDPVGLYCQKTGWQIGTRTENSLHQLIEICGKDVIGNLYNGVSLNVHPAWINTDSDSLDTLIDSDPIGYAVYCFGIITTPFYQNAKNHNSQLFPCSDRYWALARANKLLQERGAANLTELNLELARFITFMPDTDDILYKQATKIISRHIREYAKEPDKLAAMHCAGELVQLLQKVTNYCLDQIGSTDRWVHKTRYIDIAATVEDAAHGPTNIRRQKKSQRQVLDASLFSELSKMFKDSGLDKQIQAENLPGSTAWRAKYENASKQKENELLAQLAEIADLTNLALPEDNDNGNDDYNVEVRILPATIEAEEIEIAVAQDMGMIEPVEPPRKLSALELLRAKKGK